jgi:beta-lactamase regulating signal transducer with metallopeptidase domain
MTNPTAWGIEWLHGETIYVLAFTLGHFLWEGLSLALLLLAVIRFFNRAQSRYALAVCTLTAMLLAPLCTFLILSRAPDPGRASSGARLIETVTDALPGAVTRLANAASPSPFSNWPAWCAGLWFSGVLVLSLRTLGGWLVLRRMQRNGAGPLPAEWVQKCRALEQRVGLKRRILYLRSRIVDAPSAMGWLKPIVLVPVCALSGLSAEQLEAVIVHELAHIRRLDCLVNLFQVAAETLLFYHPAVWWVNRVIRNERENCCDDISVEICGNATEYAKALTLLESARTAPSWALSATGGVLRARVMRLLRPQTAVAAASVNGLAFLGVFCLAGVLLASAAVGRDVARKDWRPEPGNVVAAKAPLQSTVGSPAPAPPAMAPSAVTPAPAMIDPEIAQAAPAPPAPAGPASGSTNAASSEDSYIEGLNGAGLKDLSVDDLIALKIQGVTGEYIREMRSGGFDPSVHDLIAMKVQGISPEYVKEMRALALNPNIHDLIAMKVQGITPAYVREMQSAGLKDMQVHDLIGMKVQGIDPEYVRAIHATGLNPNLHEFIAMKVQSVTADYIRALNSAGLGELRVHDYINAKVQDVSPEFIERVRSHGFKNLTLHQLIELKNADVF